VSDRPEVTDEANAAADRVPMLPGRQALPAAMRKLSAGLRASFEASTIFDHQGTKGTVRENAVADALRPHLPTRFGLDSGTVVNASGEQSEQQDVLVVAPGLGSPFIAGGGIGLHPIETVMATLQVKSTLEARDIESAVENVASVKRLLEPQAPPLRIVGPSIRATGGLGKPFGGIVAYTSPLSDHHILETYRQAVMELPPQDRCNALFVLDRFTIVWSIGTKPNSIQFDAPGSGVLRSMISQEHSTLFFYVTLMGALDEYTPPLLNLIGYVNGAGLTWQVLETVPPAC
jgi:hypothetical protein